MISKFVDREEELAILEKEWKKKAGSLIVIYGRRRIGKTRLISEFTSNKKGVFFIAEDTSSTIQINGLKEKISEFLNDGLLKSLEIKDWDQLFNYFTKNMPKERFYLLIDEFSYLIKSDKRILSSLQKYWDSHFLTSPIYILLSGSLLGLMSESVLSYASPLYGRRSRDLLLESLKFKSIPEFLERSSKDSLETYLIIGGVPEYLLQALNYTEITQFLEKEFFHTQGYFYREPYFIISQEFKEIKTYFSILNAIAYGNTKPTEIANFVGVGAREIYPYLENLIRLGFIERQVAMLESPKKGIYLIKDQIFDFWFNFVFKYKDEIERGIFTFKKEMLNTFLGKKFEAFALKELIHQLLPTYEKFGRWWQKSEEIDLIAINENNLEIAFLECKWSNLTLKKAEEILNNLKCKSTLVNWHKAERKEQFGIIAKKIEQKEILRTERYYAFDFEDFIYIEK